MSWFKKIFYYLCCSFCCSPPDPSNDWLALAQSATDRFNGITDKTSEEAQGQLKIATEAYTALVQWAEAHQSNNVDPRNFLNNFATLTWESYSFAAEHSKADILQQVIALNEKALNLPQSGDRNSFIMATLSMNAATAYRERFIKKQDDSKDIEKSIQLYKNALGYLNEDSRDDTELTMEIGITYCTWYGRLTSMRQWTKEEGEEALQAIRNAYDACSIGQDFPRRTTFAHTLAFIYCDLLRETPSLPSCLDNAITFFQRALETMEEEDTRYPKELCALANMLFYRYEKNSTSERGTDLIKAKEEADNALKYSDVLAIDEVESLNNIINFTPVTVDHTYGLAP